MTEAERMGMDAELEVVKSELAGLIRSVDQLTVRVETIMQMQVAITRLQTQHDQNREEIGRCLVQIQEVRRKADDNESSLNRAVAFVRGMLAVGALLFAFAQWYTMQQIDTIRANSETLATIDRRLSWAEHEIYGRKDHTEGPK